MKCIITIDTEADDQWRQDGRVTLTNLDALSRFQSFMEERDIPPTYLCSYETLEHPAMRALASAHRAGRAELGGHLHPWTTPPYDDTDEKIQRFPLELPESVLADKLASLSNSLEKLLGEKPQSFRCGRWGGDERTFQAIARAGYRVDSSVTPGISWRNIVRDAALHAQLPDFSGAGAQPYVVPGTTLTQIPMSVLPTGPLPFLWLAALAHKKGLGAKIARVLSRPKWCRIFPETTLQDLKAVYTAAMRQRLPVLVFMIHSSELSVGTSPYVKTPSALEHIYELLDSFTLYLKDEGVSFVRMRELGQGAIMP